VATRCGSAVLAISPRASHGSRSMKIVAAQSSARVTPKYGHLESTVAVEEYPGRRMLAQSRSAFLGEICSGRLSFRGAFRGRNASASLFHHFSVFASQPITSHIGPLVSRSTAPPLARSVSLDYGVLTIDLIFSASSFRGLDTIWQRIHTVQTADLPGSPQIRLCITTDP
jgi:hypothetical protein